MEVADVNADPPPPVASIDEIDEDCDKTCKVRINLDFAKRYAQTKAARKWGGMSYADAVALVALQCRNEDELGFATYTVHLQESKLGKMLDMRLQQMSGVKDDADVEFGGVPNPFVGISLTALPGDLMQAFLLGCHNTAEIALEPNDEATEQQDFESLRKMVADKLQQKFGTPKRSTVLSAVRQALARRRLDKIQTVCEQHSIVLLSPGLGRGIVQASSGHQIEAAAEAIRNLGVGAVVQRGPCNLEEFQASVGNYFVEHKLGYPDFEIQPRDMEALAAARRTLATKGTVDDLAVARSIHHELATDFAKPLGEFKGPAPIEGWDRERRMWHPSTADDTLLLAVEKALKKILGGFTLRTGITDAGLCLEPVPIASDERFGSVPFLARIAKATAVLLKPQRPLDDEETTGHMIHFDCGRTLHLDKPFEEQLQWGQMEDRASRSTGKPFQEWEPPRGVREKVKEICDLLAVAWAARDFSIDADPPEALEDALLANTVEGHKLREIAETAKKSLEDVMPHSDLLKLLFPSHGAWDPTMYELRQFARGASGCRLFEELLIYLGRTGSNRKTTTLKLLTGTFGTSNKQGSRGYVCT